jgi:predicted enzyme related to lactoylglutathione lyase
MKNRTLGTALGLALAATYCVNALAAETALYHHMHLTATSAEAGAKWYAEHFGDIKKARGNMTSIGSTAFIFFEKEAGFPGSRGSAVDHIGFSVPDIEAKIKELKEASVKVVSGVQPVLDFKIAHVEDPWGTYIQLIEDPDRLGFHHIHLHSPDADATIKWYQKMFGGEIKDSFKGIDTLKTISYGKDGLMLMIEQNSEAKEPTRNRSIDHLGWSFMDLDAAAERLKSNGVNFTMDPTPYHTVRIAFLDGPEGVNIELVEPPSK